MTTSAAERETGKLAIHAENVLPIIKKWLYSDKEIFLRELLSNSVDAITKLKHVALTEGVTAAAPAIDIRIDRDRGTLTVSDTGIGMSADEIKRFIAQVAFSGAEEFLSRYKPGQEGDFIIGHFGLGFYSAFMVADKVEVVSKSYRADDPAASWVSEGGLEFSLGPALRAETGTDVILHVAEADREFLDPARVEHVVKKYCNFLPVPIRLDGKELNDQKPLWTKMPSSLKDEEYLAFFHKAYPYEDDPLFWIHLNADYPFRLQGILYFPRFRHEFEVAKGEVQLYCNQVFVAENTQDLIPRFLTVLKGMIDCPDIPLNVSRSALQNDPYMRKISAHIVKKVADKLNDLFRAQRETFEKHWEHVHPFVKFGMMEDDKFYQACRPIVLYESTNGSLATIDEYLARNREKHPQHVYYASAADQQATYLQLFKTEGMEALLLPSVLDTHFIHVMEGKEDIRWSRVDSSVSEHLVEKSDASRVVDAHGKTLDDRVKERFEQALAATGLEIKVARLKSPDVPAIVVESEYERRFKELSASVGRDLGNVGKRTLVVNSANPLVERALQAVTTDRADDLCRHVLDLARLAHEGLQGEALAEFVARSQRLVLS
ncbi:MAG: molecular chaperone HtpG [Candidatus Sericytochromatia bacterium]|nr:molecular chaperone HtpG [Candidatus Tanganyikabacteria bacterium]